MRLSLIDTHCDTAYELFLRGEDIDTNTCHVSLSGFEKYERAAQFFAFWSDKNYSDTQCFHRFLSALDGFQKTVEKSRHKIVIVKNSSEFQSAWKDQKIAAFLAIEDARLLDGDLSRLDTLHRLGIKYLTLTWAGESCIGGAHDTSVGLTDFGRSVVEKCFELSVIPDISHGSEMLADQVIFLAHQHKKPIIASHSNSYFAYPHSRNLRDRHFKDIKALGGLVSISLCPYHLGNTEDEHIKVTHVVKHIDRYMELGGEDIVGLGCDLDGTNLPYGFGGLADLYLIADELAKCGYSDSLIEKIFWKNHYNFILKNM